MANTQLPDKWIRKAIYDAFNNTVVDGKTIKVFDFAVTSKTYPDHYVLISTQFNTPLESHCGRGWQHTVQLDVTTTFPINKGTRRLCDEITEALLPLIDTLELDVASSMQIVRTSITFPGDLRESDDNRIYFRKIISVEFDVR